MSAIHPGWLGQGKRYQRTCKECGRSFVARNSQRLICSDRCRQDRQNRVQREQRAANRALIVPVNPSRPVRRAELMAGMPDWLRP